ncbi:nuclear transport factor 2 family protein [Halopseudomonas xiamenensis]|uniref:nuclear transport factor 2 family protein n=1 Tax=Halopseudomonas xiamenensis TaxID=157792 RepID=UPI00162697F7|nr:nuclear transport factor 2 family protein [Halopseudomonas xiamenensis]
MELKRRLAAALDIQAIEDQMARYIQAVDRCDLELLKSVFHADGVVDFGVYAGNAWEFCEQNIPFIKANLVMGWHRFSTVSIQLDGNRATAESYMLGNAAMQPPEGELINCPDNMRYLDVWEKRDGVWRLYSRDLILDWNTAWPYSGREDGEFAQYQLQGQRDETDLVYQHRLINPL